MYDTEARNDMNEEQCDLDCDVESLVIQHVMTALKS